TPSSRSSAAMAWVRPGSASRLMAARRTPASASSRASLGSDSISAASPSAATAARRTLSSFDCHRGLEKNRARLMAGFAGWRNESSEQGLDDPETGDPGTEHHAEVGEDKDQEGAGNAVLPP